MEKNKYLPYNININYEIRTYKNVGKDYNVQNIQQKLLRGVRRFFNCQRKKYLLCNTYSDWEKHINEIIPDKISNYKDFLHWLYKQKKISKTIVECLKISTIPMYIFLIQYLSIDSGDIFTIIIALMIILLAFMFLLWNGYENLEFYNDFIEIAEKKFNNI